ncbi:MAG: TonB family protein, partial [Candidatus Aegiribacteria sp.]|nr:TonB family protein [Candidatus Aegiribacteria sp.]MBD3295152.1 TonB family protein [Candidatus Fermentibacteria bacterium]
IHDLTRDMYDSYGYMTQEQDVINEITDTALDYQIMSDYTSFVAVSEEVRTDPDSGEPVTVQVPVNMPEGVSYDGVFGETEMQATGASTPRSSVRYSSPAPAQGLAGYGGGGASMSVADAEEVDADYYYEATEVEWTADVSHVSASPTLGLLPSEVRSAARELTDQLEEVYQSFVASIEDAEEWPIGTVTFEVTVNSSGAVTDVSVSGSGLDPDLDDELCSALEGFSLPAPPDGAGVIRLQYSFNKVW